VRSFLPHALDHARQLNIRRPNGRSSFFYEAVSQKGKLKKLRTRESSLAGLATR
jgi:hypothetical protein